MIIVDTSVWVDYFNGAPTLQTNTLEALLGTRDILIGDLILTEILQGFREDRDFRQAQRLLEPFTVVISSVQNWHCVARNIIGRYASVV